MRRIFFGSLIIFMEINKDTELQMCKCFENVAVNAQYLLLKQSNSHYVYPPLWVTWLHSMFAWRCTSWTLKDDSSSSAHNLNFCLFLIENTYQLHSQNSNFFFSIFFFFTKKRSNVPPFWHAISLSIFSEVSRKQRSCDLD